MRVFTDLSQLPSFRNAVITIGSFDGVHLGHWRILEQMQTLARSCDGESVVITFDPHPRTVLNPADASFKLLTTTAEKIALLKWRGIDNVVVAPFSLDFSRQDARQYVEDFLVKKFRPRYIVIGYDHRFGANREGDISFLKKYETTAGFEVMEIPAQEVDEIAVSSSKIRRALDAADIQLANRLLGHTFSFSGKVVAGQKIGRRIGFPTANLDIENPHKLIPQPGIYAARVYIPTPPGLGRWEGSEDAMLYIGNRPTVEKNGKQTIELNLISFTGNLYGQELTVEVVDFIRPDKKLDDLEALKNQIEADKKEIQKRLKVEGGEQHEPSTLYPQPSTDVAVVILNYNTRRHLEQFLPSVVANSGGARVIVADNGSPDDSLEFLRKNYPDVEVIDLQQNYGFAEGYNQALKQVKADIYVILNSDVEVTPGWMSPILEAMQRDPSIAIAQPKILAYSDKPEPTTSNQQPTTKNRFEYAGAAGGWIDTLGYPFCRGRIFSHREADWGQYDEPQECFWAAGAAFFIRADLYHTFGGFDGDYFAHNEEIDLCWRLKRAGYSVWCIPQSVVFHLGGGTLEYENPRKVFLNFRNSLYSLLKNKPFRKLLWLIPARFLLDGLAGARFAAKGQFRAIWAIVRAHFSFYSNFKNTVRKRRATVEIIDKHKFRPENLSGIYPGSIIVAHYLNRIKEFSKLIKR
jgi:riboflavin kinase/FMN adenylyltransferase